MSLAFCSWFVSCVLGVLATMSMLGAVSCSTHAVVASSAAGSAFSSALSGAAALGAVTLGCVFVGGLDIAVRVCSLGLASALLLLHLWLSAATAQDLAAAADRLTSDVLLPLKAAAGLDERWDCVFHGPADALYMASAVRHAASVLGSMRQMAAVMGGMSGAPLPLAAGR